MTTKQISVERFSVTSSKPFSEVLKALETVIGHPNMSTFMNSIESAKSYADVQTIVQKATGASGIMEFMRFDLGMVLRKANGEKAPRSVRLLAGNPLIMKQMVEHVPDAGSYAPVTILVDERPDGVRLSYDRMARFLASYGNADALKVARDLDAKVEAILTAAAG
ncbi:MAG: DUF302 domain-containing protein [Candidatus Acidiferrales bacterium]